MRVELLKTAVVLNGPLAEPAALLDEAGEPVLRGMGTPVVRGTVGVVVALETEPAALLDDTGEPVLSGMAGVEAELDAAPAALLEDTGEPVLSGMAGVEAELDAAPAALLDDTGEPVLIGTAGAELELIGNGAVPVLIGPGAVPRGAVPEGMAVAAAVEIRDKRLLGMAEMGEEYGERDTVAGQICFKISAAHNHDKSTEISHCGVCWHRDRCNCRMGLVRCRARFDG